MRVEEWEVTDLKLKSGYGEMWKLWSWLLPCTPNKLLYHWLIAIAKGQLKVKSPATPDKYKNLMPEVYIWSIM